MHLINLPPLPGVAKQMSRCQQKDAVAGHQPFETRGIEPNIETHVYG